MYSNSTVEILIIEDSLTQALRLQDSLEKHQFKTQIANNGKAGLDLLKQKAFTLVVSDIIMPEMDGYELCRQIKNDEQLKDMPVILLTSLSDPQDVIEALGCGADNFVTKPYNEKFLVSRIQNILVNRELRLSGMSELGIEIVFAGKKHFITSNRMQIIDLLFSTYENAIQKNSELEQVNRELIMTQRELEQKNIELARLNEQKNYFLGMAAHDLRNPMGAIYNTTELLIDEDLGPLNDEQKDIITSVKSASEFMLNLVNDFLDIAHIESGKLTLKQKPENIIQLIEKNVFFNNDFARKKQISLNFVYDKNKTFPLIYLDSSKFQQVMNNLISNAVKYTYAEGTVQVFVEKQNDKLVISVKDNGQGIPENEIESLFAPFQRTSVESTGGEKSTGLGLSIVKKIVNEHQGEIWVESQVGKGSTFFISLPLFASPAPKPKTKKKAKTKTSHEHYRPNALKSARILLVEDNITSRKVALKMLEKKGFNVDVAVNGHEAIEKLKIKNYGLVLMDIHMPEMDGFEAIKVIRDPSSSVMNHEIPVVAMTATSIDIDRSKEELINAGMNDFLLKPMHRQKLFEKIEKFIVPPETNDIYLNISDLSDEQIFNPDMLFSQVEEDDLLYYDILRRYQSKAPKYIDRLHAAIVQKENEYISKIMNTIKEESETVGAIIITNLIEKMEPIFLAEDYEQLSMCTYTLHEALDRINFLVNQQLQKMD
ncbi:multi-sensor hybrid histidine kinase [Candidatus Magnetomorum sp. HK-1]|nr:multi-sensor hybrid histidine kinase [Candidatus Magnetomorum sp. HK-1]